MKTEALDLVITIPCSKRCKICGDFLNPDILVDEQTVIDLVALLETHPECAMLAPKILNEDGTTQYLIRQRLALFDYVLRFHSFQICQKNV